MPRPRVSQARKNLGKLPAAIRLAPPAPNELEEVWRLTVTRRAEAERQLALLPEAEWLTSKLHRVIDSATSTLIRLSVVMNISRPIVVAQRPADEGNPWRVLRGGK